MFTSMPDHQILSRNVADQGQMQRDSDTATFVSSLVQTSSSMVPSSPGPFLKLPSEIRDRIYRYVCSSHGLMVHICNKRFTTTGIDFIHHSCLATITDAQAELSFDQSSESK